MELVGVVDPYGCGTCGKPIIFDSNDLFQFNVDIQCPCGVWNPRRLKDGRVEGLTHKDRNCKGRDTRGRVYKTKNPPARIIARPLGPYVPDAPTEALRRVSRPRDCNHLYPTLAGIASVRICANCGATR